MDLVTYALCKKLAKGGGSGLPDVTAADNGKVLGVDNGQWGAVDNITLPKISIDNNGDINYSETTRNHLLNLYPAYLTSVPAIIVPISVSHVSLSEIFIRCLLVGQYDAVYKVNFDVSGIDKGFLYELSDSSKTKIKNSQITYLPRLTVPMYYPNGNSSLLNKFFGFNGSGSPGFYDIPDPTIPEPYIAFSLSDPTLTAQLTAIFAAMKQLATAATDGTYVGYIPMDCSDFIAIASEAIGDRFGIYNVFANIGQTVSGFTVDGDGNITAVQYTGMDYDTSGTNPIIYTVETTLTPTMLIGKVIAKTATAFPIS